VRVHASVFFVVDESAFSSGSPIHLAIDFSFVRYQSGPFVDSPIFLLSSYIFPKNRGFGEILASQ